MILAPRHVHRARHDEQVFGAEMVRGLGHQPGRTSPRSPGGIVARQRIRQNKNEHRPLIAIPMSSAIFGIFWKSWAGLGREVTLEIVVQLDAVEAGVLGQLQTLSQVHPVRVRNAQRLIDFFIP